MAINYAELFQEVLDEQIVQESVTGWMDENAGLVQYNGGKTVKIPEMTMTGLGNYDRTNGYPAGGVNLYYETFTMTQDRATSFVLDQMDVNETNFVANATNVMAQFQRLWVIPEVDAYRISKVAQAAIAWERNNGAGHVVYGYTPSKTDIIEKLADAVEIGGYDSVILATPETVKALEVAVGANNLSAVTFARDGFDQTVPAFNGRPIIKVDPSRMYSAISTLTLDLNPSGESDPQDGGWGPAYGALEINFIVVPRTAPIAVDKLDEPKIFDPEVAQGVSGWKIEYRRYHDCWIMNNAAAGIFVNCKSAAPVVGPVPEREEVTIEVGGSENVGIRGIDDGGNEYSSDMLTVTARPEGVTCTLSGDEPGTADLRISVSESAVAGTGTISIEDIDGHSCTITLTITSA